MTTHLGDYSELVRLSLPTDEELSAESLHLVQAGSDLNVLRMLAGTDDMFAPAIGLFKSVFAAEEIEPKVRQMIIMRCATKLQCPYLWRASVLIAKNIGCTDEEIAATESDDAVHGIEPDYILVCMATDELTERGTLQDSTLTELRDRFGETLCRKYILIIGWFNLLCRYLNGCRVSLETTNKIGTRTSPTG